MIKSKKDYYYYMQQDKKALGIKKKKPTIFKDEIWRFERLLRKIEYIENVKKHNIINKIILLLCKYKYHRLSIKLGFSIPINAFEHGLSIAHYGTIVVNGNSKIGKNCRIQEGVNIGADKGNSNAPIIGDNVFIGTGAKIIGNIKIANGIAIGANAVVTKSFEEENITIAGVPAKKISEKGSKNYLNKLLKQE